MTEGEMPLFISRSPGGVYENYFIRANHPCDPYAFMIRYSLLRLPSCGEAPIGELCAIWFDGKSGHHLVLSCEVPAGEAEVARDGSSVCVGEAILGATKVQGTISTPEHHLSWALNVHGDKPPLSLLPPTGYEALFPQAKGIVLKPFALFDGAVSIDGHAVTIASWVGSVNHRWGGKHVDAYAWGQVAGFDTHEESFLEAATTCLRWGPVRTPYVTPLVMRHRGEEFAFNTFFRLCDSRGSFSEYVWVFRAETRGIRIEGTVSSPPERFVALTYRTPLGGVKSCLNTNLAACEIRFEDRRRNSRLRETLFTRHRAAFEIATDPLTQEAPPSSAP